MTKYRVTADLSGNTEDKFKAEIEADNEDQAWAIAYKNQLPRGIYNGKVEELPTRSELLARITALETAGRDLVNSLPTHELDLAREVWGSTNTRIIKEARSKLAALLNTEKE